MPASGLRTVRRAKASSSSASRAADSEQSRRERLKARSAQRRGRRVDRRDRGLGQYLVRPDLSGPRIRLGVLWFLVAVAAAVFGRWATTGLWSALAAAAAWQTTKVWMQVPRTAGAPGWSPLASAAVATVMVAAGGIGTAAAGVALMCLPLLLVLVHMASGYKPAVAGAALIGAVLAAVPSLAVVLVVRAELWSGLFLVFAVSFYDAGYFVAAAESTSRLEGPVTGIIGVLAVTFAASAVEAAPFDRVTAWMAGAVVAVACPLGQMVVSAYLPSRDVRVGAMRRLDAYLVAGPLMLAALWGIGS